MFLNTNFASKIRLRMNNKFLNKLKRLDPKNVEYKVDKEFEKETGIHGKRFQAIVRSGGREASVEEARKLVTYFSKTSGKNLSFYDIFTEDGAEEDLFGYSTDEYTEDTKQKDKKQGKGDADLDSIIDAF